MDKGNGRLCYIFYAFMQEFNKQKIALKNWIKFCQIPSTKKWYDV